MQLHQWTKFAKSGQMAITFKLMMQFRSSWIYNVQSLCDIVSVMTGCRISYCLGFYFFLLLFFLSFTFVILSLCHFFNLSLSSWLLCTVYSALFTLHWLLCTIYTALFPLHFFLCVAYSALFTLHCLLSAVYYALFTLHCFLSTVYSLPQFNPK